VLKFRVLAGLPSGRRLSRAADHACIRACDFTHDTDFLCDVRHLLQQVSRQEKSASVFLLAFGTACVLHGVYDFFLVKGWGILGVLILIYCIRKYGIIINCTLNLSEHNMNQAKRRVDLTQYLCYSLAAVVMLQYVIIAVKYGPKSANFNFLGTVFISYFLLYVVLANLRSFEIKKDEWLPLLREKQPRMHEGIS
jgi:hypothetical protein